MPLDPTFLILILLMFGAMYFLMIRPQKKHQQETAAMQASIGEGDRVMLTSGIFATVRHVGDKQMIVELAPATEITVLRQAVLRKVAAEEEEFEFDDAVGADNLDETDELNSEQTAADATPAANDSEEKVDAIGEQDIAAEPGFEKSDKKTESLNRDEQDSTKI